MGQARGHGASAPAHGYRIGMEILLPDFSTYLEVLVLLLCMKLPVLSYFIFLFLAASGLSGGTRDLLLWRAGSSLVVVRWLLSSWSAWA